MTIAEAKEELKNAIKSYLRKDEYGEYLIPTEEQRPLVMISPPGLGKTAIASQAAKELDVAFLCYSMVTHTRQSLLGLPLISAREYGGDSFDVTRYTMSEVIAEVYETMNVSGKREGVLFLDELNACSESVRAILLELLQFKKLGTNRIPAGWVIVAAGNPPEFNRSVHDFDTATWDRLRRLDVQPDYEAWKAYAVNRGIHPTVTQFLDANPDFFYVIEKGTEGDRWVTARGWEDLSRALQVAELEEIRVTENMVSQFLRHPEVSRAFSQFYDLYAGIASVYQVESILAGAVDQSVIERGKAASFDERLAVVMLLLDAVNREIRDISRRQQTVSALGDTLRNVRSDLAAGKTAEEVLGGTIRTRSDELIRSSRRAGNGALSGSEKAVSHGVIAALEEQLRLTNSEHPAPGIETYTLLRDDLDRRSLAVKEAAASVSSRLDNVFTFAETAFDEGELLILVTELSSDPCAADFIHQYGCEKYRQYHKNLLFYEREQAVLSVISELETAE